MPTNDLENHMALNTADASWNQPDARELRRFECACGVDHTPDVDRLGYPKWHSLGKFVEDCPGGSNDQEHRCCHVCALTCRICGCHYCPKHQKGFSPGPLNLCEECGAYYTTFAPAFEAEAEKLITIEARMARGRPYGHGGEPLQSEVDWLIQELKEAWEALASAPRRR